MARAEKRDAASKPTRGNAKPTRTRHDWLALERAFVTGGTDDLAEFSRTRGLNRSVVAEKASAEGWRDKRAAHVGKVHAKATERIQAQQVTAESEIDGKAHRIALRLLDKFEGLLDSVEDASQAKSLAQGLAETWVTARKTAHLTPEPQPAAQADEGGVIRIRRRAPSGEEVEVEFGSSAAHRPDGQDTDADAVGVPSGPDADPVADGGRGLGQVDVGR